MLVTLSVIYLEFKAHLTSVITLPSLDTESPIPLSLSPIPRLLWSERGHKFLEEIISSWPDSIERESEFP